MVAALTVAFRLMRMDPIPRNEAAVMKSPAMVRLRFMGKAGLPYPAVPSLS